MTRPLLQLALLSLLAIRPTFADEPALGRLFLTPAQRDALDRQRLQSPGLAEQQGSQTLNGEVRRNDGRRMRWINGEARWNNDAAAPRVPVGDTYYPATGERESLLGNGRITVKPGSAGR